MSIPATHELKELRDGVQMLLRDLVQAFDERNTSV